ncbi:TRIO and F-actin-binding protein-like isoform X1 [Arapaima gigas]
MTRLDPSPQRPYPQSWMEDSRGRERSRRNTGMMGERIQQSGIHSLKRAGSSHSVHGDSPPLPFRHSEVGRPLPSTRIPEPKASIPFRNPDLGIPSKMRAPDVDMLARSPSPPKYSQHSNFRRRSPRSLSPRHTFIPTPFKQAELNATQRQTRDSSLSKPSVPDLSSSGIFRSASQASILSSLSSPSQSPSLFKQNESLSSNYDTVQFSERQKEEFRSPTQSPNGPVLDSEYLYKNLNLIARTVGSDSFSSKTEVDNPSPGHGLDGRSRSRTCRSHHTPEQSHINLGQEFDSRSPTQLLPSYCGSLDPNGRHIGRSRRGRDLEALSPSTDYTGSPLQTRSPSPQRQQHSSSLSSSESEPSRTSGGSDSEGPNMEEYAVMADLPKPKIIYPREGLWQKGRGQNHSPIREELRRQTNAEGHQGWSSSVERGRQKERGRKRQKQLRIQRDRTPCAYTTTSLHSPLSDYEACLMFSSLQPDLLNFKKGWMSKLDEDGEWRKHWFVLTDDGLKYYRDSKAEEKDDLDGEIDLSTCIGVSEFDVEKNYGFQIQTREAMFTLSAMTSGIRRNWLEVLRNSVLPSSDSNATQIPDCGNNKENSVSSTPSSHCLSTHRGHNDSGLEVVTSSSNQRALDYVELTPVVGPPTEGQPAQFSGTEEDAERQQAKRLEDRTRWFESGLSTKEPLHGSSPWDAVLLKKGLDPDSQMEVELERKWVEFERLPLQETKSLPLMATPTNQPVSEALEREVSSLRVQVEQLQQGRGSRGGRRQCGPAASCGRSLEAMERAHREALDELQRQHVREVKDLQGGRDRLLQEETQATVQALEALKMALREELEEEVARARRLCGGATDLQSLQIQSETQVLQRELDDLSEQYSQKCLELNRAQKSIKEREQEISRRLMEVEQLKKENQELQTRLGEEIARMRAFITGEGSEDVLHGNRERSSCELEVLLRVKENEVHYLHKEISCLRDELHSLSKEKRLACERFKELSVELSTVKNHSEQEMEALREHLRLTTAALKEAQQLNNSLPH